MRRFPFLTSEEKLKINYYEVSKESSLYKSITDYLGEVSALVERAERLVKKYGAVSAEFGVEGLGIAGLNFALDTEPLHWGITWGGQFRPYDNDPAWKEFIVPIPVFQSDLSDDMLDDSRYGVLGNKVIFGIPPNKDGSAARVPGATFLQENELKILKAGATATQKKDIEDFTNPYWEAAPFAETAVFDMPQQIKDLNVFRMRHAGVPLPFNLLYKHSHPRRRLRRFLKGNHNAPGM